MVFFFPNTGHNGAMFPNLLPGSHVLKLNCCSVEDKCGKSACIQRKLSWQLCPSSFRSRVTISGRNVTLSYAPHPRAMYKCSLYSRSSNELIQETSPCTYDVVWVTYVRHLILTKCYYIILRCVYSRILSILSI